MFPRLPVIGFPTYGLLVALGFVLGLVVIEHLGRRHGFARHVLQDVVVRTALWGLVGAKVLLVALDPGPFLENPLGILTQGGVFYGGLAIGALGGWVRSRRLGLDPHDAGDVVMVGLALAHAIGRVGCFLAGCCWGSACTLPWAVSYTDPRSNAVAWGLSPAERVHPVQLYEAGLELLLFGAALWLLSRRPFTGAVIWSWVAAYGALRIVLEELRGDPRGSVLGGAVSTSQVVGAAAVGAGFLMLAVRARRHARGALPPTALDAGPSA